VLNLASPQWLRQVASVVLALCVALGPSGVLRPATARAAVGTQAQSIREFLPPYTAVVGDTLTLSAAATSGLSVSFSTDTPDVCSISEAQVTMLQAGSCSVTATQEGDDRFALATKSQSIDVSAVGYHAVATVTSPSGSVRTDGQIFIGDTLAVRLSLPGETVSKCYLRISTAGGWLMQFWGAAQQDGSCTGELTIPAPAQPDVRGGGSRGSNDVCLYPVFVYTSAGNNIPMRTSDRMRPGNYRCYNGADASGRFDEVLDFAFDGTGDRSVSFHSTPNILSWNMQDWDPTYVPLAFNTDWHVQMPDWIGTCNTMLNGSWTTGLSPSRQNSCPDWHLRLPGVLPAAMPWGGEPGNWGVEIVMSYTDRQGDGGGSTISYQDVPYAPSDGVFTSSLPMVFPKDLSSTRFVTLGDVWTPSFHVTAGGSQLVPDGTVCKLHVVLAGWSYSGWPQQVIDAGGVVAQTTPDESGDCTFTVATPYTETTHGNQYWVGVDFPGGNPGDLASYSSTIFPVLPMTPPTILDPAPNQDGSTDIEAASGDGQGLSLEVEVAPEVAPAMLARQHNLSVSRAAVADVPVCATVAYTSNLASGGAVPNAAANCSLAPGRYVVTARMVDVTGKTLTTTRQLIIASPDVRAAATVKPTVSGTLKVGKTLIAAKGTWTGYPAPTFRYQWYVCTKAVTAARSTVPSTCKRISGATRSTYKLTSAQRGKYVAVLVTGTSLRTAATTWLSKTTAKIR